MKLKVDRGDSLNICDNNIQIELKNQTTGPYVVTWWDNHWSPSAGFHANDLCENTVITTEVLDMNCRHMHANLTIMPDSVPQVYLDTVVAILPSSPGACDGYLSFHFRNVLPSYTRSFGNSGSGGVVFDSV